MLRTPLPRWLLAAAVVTVLVMALPLVGLAVRIPWADVPTLLSSEAARDAMTLSLRTCALSTVLCILLGTLWRCCSRAATAPSPRSPAR